MKRFLLILAFAIFMVLRVDAQEYSKADQVFKFVYITFDEKTETQKLIDRLTELYNYAMDYPENYAVVFYMPNGEDPIVVKINVVGDNYKDFDKIIAMIQRQPSNIVMADYDVEHIHSLFEENDIIDMNGRRIYKSVDWVYYVNSSFWMMRNNENVIARLFFTMDMAQMIALKYMTVNIFCSKGKQGIQFNQNKPFGDKELCRAVKLVPLPF